MNVADRIALGRLVLPVDSDALGQLAQRRGSSPFRGEQVPGHRTGQGLMADGSSPATSLRGQQQRESLLLLTQIRVCAGPVSQVPAARSEQ